MSTPTRWGGEFLVNTTSFDEQKDPAVAVLSTGNFVVVFHDESQTGTDSDQGAIRAQIFRPDGSKFGAEFVVNSTTDAQQYMPAVAPLSDGRFIITFADDSRSPDDPSQAAVRGQIFHANGSRYGDEFLVNSTTDNGQFRAEISALENGRFVVAFADGSESGGDQSSSAVRAQIFNPDGSTFGTEFLVNSTTLDVQADPVIATLTNGRFVIAFVDKGSSGGDPSNDAVRAQVFDPNGDKFGLEFLVNSTTANGQRQPSIAALADGRFVIAFTDASATGDDTSGNAVRAQIFNADGSKSGSEFVVNTTTQSQQKDPIVTALADGRFVISFSDFSQSGGDTSHTAVRAQLFNSDGTKSGEEFLVNSTTSMVQYGPSSAGWADGRFVITFSDESLSGDDSSGSAVRAQIFDTRTAAIDAHGTPWPDVFVGTDFADILRGNRQDDALYGGGEDDFLKGGRGRDYLSGGEGADKMKGGRGHDYLNGSEGIDRMKGHKGRDYLDGGDGADKMKGGRGHDYLDGGEGGDRLNGGKGRDVYVIDSSDDIVVEKAGRGKDTIVSVVKDIDLREYRHTEHIDFQGNSSREGSGNRKNNKLSGGDGHDILQGRGGRDRYIGNDGSDSFDFNRIKHIGKRKADRDRIKDFEQGQDSIDLWSIDADASLSGKQPFQFIGYGNFSGTAGELRYTFRGDDTLVMGDVDGDGRADFKLQVNGLIDLQVTDFYL